MTSMNHWHDPDGLSRIGGAAQGGSTKTPKEREALDRRHQEQQQDGPAGAGHEIPETPAAPESNNERSSDRQSSADRAD
jgi:hypothetical protein